ncbi:phage portal protein [Haladaptatus pallidirubidus]|uniref:Portal protein n=1 Tax=Haladaptatus pallidirubidus TaxID=1008152 RepID=A0AAV3UBV4_9EURY|nr:phage portal protein [Haladaptatus pallidirubidus]
MSDSLFSRALRERRRRANTEKSETTVGGETIQAEDSGTAGTYDVEDTFLTTQEYGVPRGTDAWEARELGETPTMEIIKNTVIDQLNGVDLAFVSDDGEEFPSAVEEFQNLLRDIIEGPHTQNYDFDDLVASSIADMIDTGYGYWQPLASKDGSIPVLMLKPLDPLSVQHNLTQEGEFDEPAFYQAPFQTVGGSAVSMAGIEPTALEQDDLVQMHWKGSTRTNRPYVMCPTMQVKEYLRHIKDSTVHLGRYYSDNQIPPGILQWLEASDSDLKNVRKQIKDASGDPRKAPSIGGSGQARWVDIGGDKIQLDVIEEQKWFKQLCWATIGVNKHEMGIIEDVNRNTASEVSTIIYKRVTLPLTQTFEQAINRQLLPKFDVYRTLDKPFRVSLQHSDPVREREHEKALLERWNQGAISYREYRQQLGEDAGETVVSINDEEIDFGALPKHIGERALRAVSSGDTVEVDGGDLTDE